MYTYINSSGTVRCVIWEIEEDSHGENVVNFTVNGCMGSTAKLYCSDDLREYYFYWKEITFYLSDFKEVM